MQLFLITIFPFIVGVVGGFRMAIARPTFTRWRRRSFSPSGVGKEQFGRTHRVRRIIRMVYRKKGSFVDFRRKVVERICKCRLHATATTSINLVIPFNRPAFKHRTYNTYEMVGFSMCPVGVCGSTSPPDTDIGESSKNGLFGESRIGSSSMASPASRVIGAGGLRLIAVCRRDGGGDISALPRDWAAGGEDERCLFVSSFIVVPSQNGFSESSPLRDASTASNLSVLCLFRPKHNRRADVLVPPNASPISSLSDP